MVWNICKNISLISKIDKSNLMSALGKPFLLKFAMNHCFLRVISLVIDWDNCFNVLIVIILKNQSFKRAPLYECLHNIWCIHILWINFLWWWDQFKYLRKYRERANKKLSRYFRTPLCSRWIIHKLTIRWQEVWRSAFFSFFRILNISPTFYQGDPILNSPCSNILLCYTLMQMWLH